MYSDCEQQYKNNAVDKNMQAKHGSAHGQVHVHH